jgi:hypothetical protein
MEAEVKKGKGKGKGELDDDQQVVEERNDANQHRLRILDGTVQLLTHAADGRE